MENPNEKAKYFMISGKNSIKSRNLEQNQIFKQLICF